MFKAPESNWDQRPLAADHSVARAAGGHQADRLLHFTCNCERGDGHKDHQRPSLTGRETTAITRERLAMDW